MMKKTVKEIREMIKEGMFELLIEDGEVTGQIDLYAKDMDGRTIKSIHVEKGRIVKAYMPDSYHDIEIKEDFCFYHDGDVLLFTYHDEDYFTMSEI